MKTRHRQCGRWFLAAWVAGLAGLAVAVCQGQTTVAEWQAVAVRKYPELSVAGSPFNQKFVQAVTARRGTNPAYFADPRWPLALADELASARAVAPAPLPVAASPVPSAPAPVPVRSTTPAPPPAEYDAGPPPKITGLEAARFRWWAPAQTQVRGVLVLLAGRGSDGRGMTGDRHWQELATKAGFGLLGCDLVNPKDDLYSFQGDPGGSVSDLLNKSIDAVLTQVGQKIKDPPLAFWGHSAGGNVTQQYLSRHANRAVGAVLMRATDGPGGLAPGKDEVPVLICVGQKDKPDWVAAALASYQRGRSVRANWTLALNPREGHEIGKTQPLALAYLAAVINLRLPAPAGASSSFSSDEESARITRLNKQTGWLGDPQTYEIAAAENFSGKRQDAVWLPDETSAKAWQEYLRGP